MEVTGTVGTPIKLNFASYTKHFKMAFPHATQEGCFDAFFSQSLKVNPVFTPDEFNKRYLEEYSAALGTTVTGEVKDSVTHSRGRKPILTEDEKILRKRAKQREYDQKSERKEKKAKYMKEYNAKRYAEKIAQREREGLGFVTLAQTKQSKEVQDHDE